MTSRDVQLTIYRRVGRFVRRKLAERDARIVALEGEVRVLRQAIAKSTTDDDVLRMLASGPGDADD